MTAELMWRIPSSTVLYIEEWEENAIVYQSLSGETHYLNGLAVEVLKLTQQVPATLTAYAEKICTTFQVEDKSDLEQQIKQLLNELENLGLIESIARED